MIDRQSNFELLRLVAMLMVMVCHAVGYVQESDLVDLTGASRLVITQLCAVCVNVFVMISGWFGIKASVKGAVKLLFQIWFLALLCFGTFAVFGLPVSFKKDLLPYLLFGSGYWFVVSYLILYILTPVLNVFAQTAFPSEFRSVLIAFFLAEFVFGFLLDRGHFHYGFSPLFFVGLYLLARFVRLHPGRVTTFSKRTDFFIYLSLSVLSIFGFWFGYKWFGMGFHLNHYDSPLTILATLYFLLFFSKLKFQNKAINWLAVSAFAIYLLHENALVSPYYHLQFSWMRDNLPLYLYYPLLFCIVLILGLLFILIDKLRMFAWSALLKSFNLEK